MPLRDGNDGRSSRWGNGPTFPDLDDLIQKGRDRLRRMMPGGGSPRSAIFVAILVLAALGAWTAYYTVPSDSVAVVQRFGKYLKDVPPGLHFKLPLGIDAATVVPVKRQLKQEFGFTTPGATDPYQSPRDGKRETEMVTGDLNAALVESRHPEGRWAMNAIRQLVFLALLGVGGYVAVSSIYTVSEVAQVIIGEVPPLIEHPSSSVS